YVDQFVDAAENGLVHLLQRIDEDGRVVVNAGNAGGNAVGGGCDAVHGIRHGCDDLVHGTGSVLHFTGAAHRVAALLDQFARTLGQVLQSAVDLGGGATGLVGQRLDLAGNHGKALSGLAGPCRLDRGVESQQVGLPGDG